LWQQQGNSKSRWDLDDIGYQGSTKAPEVGDVSTLQSAGGLCQAAAKVMDFARRSRQKNCWSICAIGTGEWVRLPGFFAGEGARLP